MNKTQAKILRAAEELLAQKGIAGTTIADIADRANVAHSHAYRYFKGKKGLVFAVAHERIKDTLRELHDQLQGISEPKSRLSKFIWYALVYIDRNRDFVRNLMFEYRSSREFYDTPAYALMREHAGICSGILNQGVQAGLYRRDVDMRLITELIYGTVDMEAVHCVMLNETRDIASDWEDILHILFAMIEERPQPHDRVKRCRILRAAEAVFAEKGYEKAKVAQIAKTAGVAEGSIYDYFKNKENLLISISSHRLTAITSQLAATVQLTCPLARLRRFLRLHFCSFLKNRDFLKVFIMDSLMNRKFYQSEALDVHRTYIASLAELIRDGQAQGVFKKEINPRVFCNMFMGAFIHMALRWILFPDRPVDKMKEIDHLTDIFSRGVTDPCHLFLL
ncbi:MAG: TetR/AcrR family transcriptional regulator [Desulfobacterium sp.]|nr:TetR/AcrR family transcriptional regulator [Desulfobacterium sp.]